MDMMLFRFSPELQTLSGAAPPPLGQPPLVITPYYLSATPVINPAKAMQSSCTGNSVASYCAPSPSGDWWRKRGASLPGKNLD
jgi:hypothetical protein